MAGLDAWGSLFFNQGMQVLGNAELWGVAIIAFFLGIMIIQRDAKVEYKLMVLVCAIFLAAAYLPILMIAGAAIIAVCGIVIYKRITGW